MKTSIQSKEAQPKLIGADVQAYLSKITKKDSTTPSQSCKADDKKPVDLSIVSFQQVDN